jgi:hypothetical protein
MSKASTISRRGFLEAIAALGSLGLASCAANERQASRLSAIDRATGKLPARSEFVVRNAYVVTMDPKLGDIPRADVHVRNGALVAVGPNMPRPVSNRSTAATASLYRGSSILTFICGAASRAASSPMATSIIFR